MRVLISCPFFKKKKLDSKGRTAKTNLIHAAAFLSAHLAVGPRLGRGQIQYTVCALFYYLLRRGGNG